MDAGPGAAPWADLEGPDETHAQAHESRQVAVHAEPAALYTGVCSDGRDPAASKTCRQLAREEHVGQLGAAVGLHSLIALLALQIFESHAMPRGMVPEGREIDDARGRGGTQAIEQESGEVEV